MSQIALLEKLYEVCKAIAYVEKRGHNQHHNYDFAQAVDVTRTVREKLIEQKLVVIPSATNARHLPYGSKGAHLTTVDLSYRVCDVETGAEVVLDWVGVGADTGGDKGIYKAYTGGFKYALLNLFQIPTSNDPEGDDLTTREGDGGHKDDDRPAAPRIPVDRARTILDLAIAAGIAEQAPDGSVVMHAVLKALLATHGVEKIGQLNVDQAEAIEAFLAEEAKS